MRITGRIIILLDLIDFLKQDILFVVLNNRYLYVGAKNVKIKGLCNYNAASCFRK